MLDTPQDATALPGPADRPEATKPATRSPDQQAPLPQNIYAFIWQYSRLQQIGLLILTLAAFPFLYLSLELPKRIINQIQAGYDTYVANEGSGAAVDQAIETLVLLCLTLLGLILINGMFKMWINTRKGVIGERMVRRLRYGLIERLLRFRPRHLERLSSGEAVSTISTETEPLAGFIGDSIAQPVFQFGTMLTILVFMFVQDWVLGLAAVSLIPVQGWLIPRLQRRVNQLAKQRVRHVRALAERITETMDGAMDLRQHGLHRYTLADFSWRLGSIFDIRLEIYKRKFFIKFINNLINQITPFFFYLIGGILAIQGSLSLGALVAAITAFKDLTAPWKELLNYYQRMADSRIKYAQILEQFQPPDLYPGLMLWEPEARPARLNRDIEVEGLMYVSELGERVLNGISMTLPTGKTIIIQGDTAPRRARLASLLAGNSQPASGSVTIGTQPVAEIDPVTRAWRLGYVGPNPFIIRGTITDNALYGLRLRPPTGPREPGDAALMEEALASGARDDLFPGSWKDLETLGLTEEEHFKAWWIEVTHVIDSANVIYQRGLLEQFDPQDRPQLATKLLQARATAAQAMDRNPKRGLIARFDATRYNPTLTLFENLVFGLRAVDAPTSAEMLMNPALCPVLEAHNLMDDLVRLRDNSHRVLVERFGRGDLSAECIERYDFLDRQMVRFLNQTWAVVQRDGFDALPHDQQMQLMDFLLCYSEDRHALGLMDEALMTRIVAARGDIQRALGDLIIPFDPLRYHPRLSVRENVLFGRPYYKSDRGQVDHLLRASLMSIEGAVEDVMFLLMESQAGVGGSRLPLVARQRLSLARWINKKPDILIVHEAISAYDEVQRQELRRRIRRSLPEVTLIWIDEHVTHLDDADLVVTLADGRVQSAGPPTSAAAVSASADI